MKKIAIMGMCNHPNLGDQIIPRTVGYLVERIGNVQYKYVNFIDQLSGKRYEKYVKIRSKLKSDKQIYELMKIYVWNTYEEQLQDCDGIIIACGSFKYRTQYLWASYCIVLEYAKVHDIPVMFNAMNIQNFDKNDWRCRMLQNYINNGCVKIFTTRDGNTGVKKLMDDYVTSKIQIMSVGDPAFWVKEAYEDCILNGKSKTGFIGINLIRADIFKDYGGNITEDYLISFYIKLIKLLNENYIKWSLFTNGMSVDEQIAIRISEEITGCGEKIFVPHTDQELVHFISSCDAIIGARLHACIIAYSIGIPFVGFYWDEKIMRFAQDNELCAFFCEEANLTPETVFEMLGKSREVEQNKKLLNMWKEKTLVSLESFVTQML